MIKWPPTLYRYKGRWWYGGLAMWGTDTYWGLTRELWWMLWSRHTKFTTGWQWPELIFGCGREWYDGPIWYVHLGFFSVDLSMKDNR